MQWRKKEEGPARAGYSIYCVFQELVLYQSLDWAGRRNKKLFFLYSRSIFLLEYPQRPLKTTLDLKGEREKKSIKSLRPAMDDSGLLNRR